MLQEPTTFIPPWSGENPESDSRCEQDGQFTCGVIICTIADLAPFPEAPIQVTLFARLFVSPYYSQCIMII